MEVILKSVEYRGYEENYKNTHRHRGTPLFVITQRKLKELSLTKQISDRRAVTRDIIFMSYLKQSVSWIQTTEGLRQDNRGCFGQ